MEAAKPGKQPHGLAPRKLGRPRHHDEPRRLRVAQQRDERANRFRHLDELRRQLTGADERAVFQQYAQQHLRPLPRGIGHLEQPQRVPGWRRVNDDHVVVPARIDHGEDAEQLVDAGRGKVHQLGRADPGAGARDAGRRCDLVERACQLHAPVGERTRRVQLAHDQVPRRAGNRARGVVHVCAKDVRQRMRRVGRQEEHATVRVRARQPQGDRRGHGRLADAALAAKKQQRRPLERVDRFRRAAVSATRAENRAGRDTGWLVVAQGRTRVSALAEGIRVGQMSRELRQRRHAPRFSKHGGNGANRPSAGETAADRGHGLPLVRAPAFAEGTRAAVGQHAIDDDLAHLNPGALERREAIAGLRKRERLRQREPDERCPGRIAQPLRRLARLPGEDRDQSIGRLGTADARELLPNETVLLLEIPEDVGHRGHRFRRRQQPQRVAGRRGVDNDEVIGTPRPRSPPRLGFLACCARFAFPFGEAGDLEDPHQLIDAGNREIEQRVHVLAIEPGAVLEDLTKWPAVILQPPRERARRVELHGVERWSDACGTAGQPHAEGVAKRVRGIGRDDQHATRLGLVSPKRRRRGGGFGHGAGGRARRFAHAAFSTVEDDPRQV